MKALIISAACASIALASAASAAPKPKNLADALFDGPSAAKTNWSPNSNGNGPKPKVDRDQGDDHASDRAIERVCGGNTPAAQRSAICNGGPPASP